MFLIHSEIFHSKPIFLNCCQGQKITQSSSHRLRPQRNWVKKTKTSGWPAVTFQVLSSKWHIIDMQPYQLICHISIVLIMINACVYIFIYLHCYSTTSCFFPSQKSHCFWVICSQWSPCIPFPSTGYSFKKDTSCLFNQWCKRETAYLFD